jgi:hypothetical protein
MKKEREKERNAIIFTEASYISSPALFIVLVEEEKRGKKSFVLGRFVSL